MWTKIKFERDVLPWLAQDMGGNWQLLSVDRSSGLAKIRRDREDGIFESLIISPLYKRDGAVRFQTKASLEIPSLVELEKEFSMLECWDMGTFGPFLLDIVLSVYAEGLDSAMDNSPIRLFSFDPDRRSFDRPGWGIMVRRCFECMGIKGPNGDLIEFFESVSEAGQHINSIRAGAAGHFDDLEIQAAKLALHRRDFTAFEWCLDDATIARRSSMGARINASSFECRVAKLRTAREL